MGLRKAGGNWVEGDRFFDREAEIEALMERVEDGTHTLVTAQRRMGKTSLVRELLRRLREDGNFGASGGLVARPPGTGLRALQQAVGIARRVVDGHRNEEL